MRCYVTPDLVEAQNQTLLKILIVTRKDTDTLHSIHMHCGSKRGKLSTFDESETFYTRDNMRPSDHATFAPDLSLRWNQLLSIFRRETESTSETQARLLDARKELLDKRETVRARSRKVQLQRIDAGNAEIILMNHLRAFFNDQRENMPVALIDAYETVATIRSELGVAEDDYLHLERELSSAEWIYIDQENDFYQFELEILAEKLCDINPIETQVECQPDSTFGLLNPSIPQQCNSRFASEPESAYKVQSSPQIFNADKRSIHINGFNIRIPEESVLEEVGSWGRAPTMKQKTLEWLFTRLRQDSLEKVMYSNILRSQDIYTTVSEPWEVQAAKYWNNDSTEYLDDRLDPITDSKERGNISKYGTHSLKSPWPVKITSSDVFEGPIWEECQMNVEGIGSETPETINRPDQDQARHLRESVSSSDIVYEMYVPSEAPPVSNGNNTYHTYPVSSLSTLIPWKAAVAHRGGRQDSAQSPETRRVTWSKLWPQQLIRKMFRTR